MAHAQFDAEKITTFQKLVDGAVEYANKHQLPIVVVEAAMRDVLAGAEAHRLVRALRANGAKI